jgi:NAD(P)-dependent dehydrogenase (short-subunit alcohol dehydrogenase family)
VASAKSVLDAANAAEERYTRDLASLTTRRDTAKKDLAKARRSLLAHQATAESLEFWVDKFRELRFVLAQDALDELAVDVNSALGRLGLPQWSISFDVERETTTKNIARGMFVYVHAPGAPKRVPFKAWCGGETQRLRVAGSVGVSNLISSRKGIRSGIEVWDEPTAHLSEEGVLELLEFFKDRAEEEGKRIWLADHRSPAFGGFLVGQEAARRMLPAGRGSILFTGASASVKGYPQSASFAMGKFALRGLAQSMARELGPQGLHVAHVVIDGVKEGLGQLLRENGPPANSTRSLA